jgi:hypothetical protein
MRCEIGQLRSEMNFPNVESLVEAEFLSHRYSCQWEAPEVLLVTHE